MNHHGRACQDASISGSRCLFCSNARGLSRFEARRRYSSNFSSIPVHHSSLSFPKCLEVPRSFFCKGTDNGDSTVLSETPVPQLHPRPTSPCRPDTHYDTSALFVGAAANATCKATLLRVPGANARSRVWLASQMQLAKTFRRVFRPRFRTRDTDTAAGTS